jgi:hypothetical protein
VYVPIFNFTRRTEEAKAAWKEMTLQNKVAFGWAAKLKDYIE